MKNITFFRTRSYVTYLFDTQETRDFETRELAKQNAENDKINEKFHFYKVTMTFNGRIEYQEEYLGEIPCGYEIDKENHYYDTKPEDRGLMNKPMTNWTGRA